ncbi:ferritin-like domain-containing protein [Ekhidna sp.]|uniref:YciE/YciF ferroxidase family protein n=1 Tax=Ekhidna sp. TaxID=2608089 RepID=UPI003B5B1FF9
MKKIASLKDLMMEQLRDLYHSENELDDLLKKMIESASEPRLRKIFEDYLFENKEQVMRLRQAFEPLFEQKRGEMCDAMLAMTKEARDLINRSADEYVRDAGLITALQHIIHYQIAGYGAVCTYAQMLNFDNVASIIHKNLEVEKHTDRELAMLAEDVINERAIKMV